MVLGDALRLASVASSKGYAASTEFEALERLGNDHIDELARIIENLLSDTNIILSNEGWFERIGEFRQIGLFRKISARIEIVVYVRPQVEFINASWWQWGVWSDMPFAQWLTMFGPQSNLWGLMTYYWSLTEGVDAVFPRLMTADVVADFFEFLDCDLEPGTAVELNRSLPAVALRFLQRHPELRPGPHHSEIDFILGRALREIEGRRPWILPLDFVSRIIEQSRKDNLDLQNVLPPPHREMMAADPRWWDPAFFADRAVEPSDALLPVAGELDAFALALVKALRDSDRKLSRLRA